MLINMHKDLNCNMVNLVEKLGANVWREHEINGILTEKWGVRPGLSTPTLTVENIGTQMDKGVKDSRLAYGKSDNMFKQC